MPFKHSALVFFFFLVMVSLPYAAETDLTKIQVLEIAEQDPRVKDILLDFPAISLKPHYAEEYNAWIVDILHDETKKVGLVTISPTKKEIMEFNFNIKALEREPEEERQYREREERAARGIISKIKPYLPHFGRIPLAWLSFFLVMLTAANFSRFRSWRNVDLLLLYALCPFLTLIWVNTQLAFTGIFVITLFMFIRCILAPCMAAKNGHLANFTTNKVLYVLLGLTVFFHIQTVFEKPIGDAGLWSAIGTEYLAETGRLPYGTEFGPNCIYGPLMYTLFLPANLIAPPHVQIDSHANIVSWGEYEKFNMMGVQSTVLMLDLLALFALYRLGKRQGGPPLGLLVCIVYGLSPYILGVVSEMGLERASHVAAVPFILFAMLFRHRGWLSGLLLGIATGMLYFSVFLVPFWFGHGYFKNNKTTAWQFFLAYGAVGVACLLFIMFFTVPDPSHAGMSPLSAFLNDTILQQQYKDGYGNSELSFWGQYPALAAWGKPLTSMAFLLFCCGLPWLFKQGTEIHFTAGTAAILVGTQLVLSFAGGTYIGFYLAPLILTIFYCDNTTANHEGGQISP
ncbi:hypothetical protein GF373_01815 [bacterium]|nr:hypothetical protein [bacterium]